MRRSGKTGEFAARRAGLQPAQDSRSVGRNSDLIQEVAVEAASREIAIFHKIPQRLAGESAVADAWTRKECPVGWSEINPGWGDRDR
jgi:hypothetical protein